MQKIDKMLMVNIPSFSSKHQETPKSDFGDDCFEKSKVNDSPEFRNAVQILSRADFEEFTNELIEKDYWSDSYNFVGFNKKDGLINSVGIGVHNPNKSKLNKQKLSVSEFSDMYTEITANNINETPDKEKEYKTAYLKLIKYLKDNQADS